MTRTKELLSDHLTAVYTDTTPPKPDVCRNSGSIYIDGTKIAYITITGDYDITTSKHPTTITPLTRNATRISFNSLDDLIRTITANILNQP